MVISNEELLQKATMTSTAGGNTGGDVEIGGTGNAPLAIQQVMAFLRLAITPQRILPLARTVTHSAPLWQESKIDFTNRVMRAGTQGVRLDTNNRVVPDTGLVEMNTVLIRGEVPIADEVFEDQTEGAGFGSTIVAQLAEAVGRDIEELYLLGDTAMATADPYLGLNEGWLKLARGTAGNTVDCASFGQDFQTVFRELIEAIHPKYKRDKSMYRFFVPVLLEEKYRDQVADRGTALGDAVLQGTVPLRYMGVPIIDVPLMDGSTAGDVAANQAGTNAVSSSGAITRTYPNTTGQVFFVVPRNLYAGYQRSMRIETWRDPREGAMSYVVTLRGDAQIAVPEATSIGTNVDLS